MCVFASLVAVAAVAGRHDVAEVVLAASADRHDMLHLQVAVAAAVGTAVIKAGPVPPEVHCTQMHRLATTLNDLASLGLSAVIQPIAGVSHKFPTRSVPCTLAHKSQTIVWTHAPVILLLRIYKLSYGRELTGVPDSSSHGTSVSIRSRLIRQPML